MTKNCKYCRYSQFENEAKGTMFCRRYAPRPGTDFEEWPLVWDEDWCGEWAPEEAEADDARVFPRRTAMTPDDDYAFVGDPPLFLPEDNGLAPTVSITRVNNCSGRAAEWKKLQREWSRPAIIRGKSLELFEGWSKKCLTS